MYFTAFILLALWSLVGSFDAAYYHDKKHSLHLHAKSIREHLYHTIRAICYPIIIFSLFYKNFDGIILWVGIFAILIDTIFFMLDAFEEKNSREQWGGLSHGEYITHLISNTLHYCAITAILLSKKNSPGDYPAYLSIIALVFVVGGTLTAIQHIWRLYKFESNN